MFKQTKGDIVEEDILPGNNQEAPLDLNAVREASDGDVDFERELLEVFVADCTERLATLKEGLNTANLEIIRREAHTIKGASSNVGAFPLQSCALAVERAGVSQDLELAKEHFIGMQQEFERVKAFIVEHLSAIDAKGE